MAYIQKFKTIIHSLQSFSTRAMLKTSRHLRRSFETHRSVIFPQHGFYNVIIKNGTVLTRAYAFIEFNDSSYQPHDRHKEAPPLPHFLNCPIFDLTSLLLIISEFTRRHTRKSFKKPCKIILFGIPHSRRNIAYAFIGKDKHFLSLFNF